MKKIARLPLAALTAAATLLTATPVLADVPTARVEARATPAALAAEATLEAVRQVTVAARVPGRIVALAVDAGDAVAHGDEIVRIDAAEAEQALAAARAAVAQAEAALANARAEHARATSLLARNFVSQSAVDQTRTALASAEAQLRAARAAREQAATVRGYTSIAAPLDGVVAARHVEPGEMAMPGAPLVTIFDPAAMRAVIDVPQARLAGLAADALAAQVELVDSGRRIAAQRVVVLPAADARTHTLRLRVELPAGVDGIVPGMFARVHLTVGEALRVRVPVEAVVRRSELTAVYVVDAQGRFSLRQIRVGERHADGTIEVLAGLVGGEEIALDPVAAGIAARASGR